VLNDLDERIVHALAEDARRSYADIGQLVGLSAPAVKRRVDRLRATGAITGFTVRVDPAALGWETEGFVEIYCRSNTSPETIQRGLERYQEVVAASTVTGDADAVAQVFASDMRHFERVLERIAGEPFVERTKSVLVLSPLLVGLALAIRILDGRPVLFRQTRVGRDGRLFTIYKFRTMVTDAEARKAELVELNEHDGVLFKIKEDPRVTRVGRVLRRYSLDELPQLLNVLRGEMSLVGPRPPLPDEVARYEQDVRRRLAVKPGMTGLWQVSGRSDLSWEESVRLDVRYVENWSLILDLQILWKTWSAVFRASGAY